MVGCGVPLQAAYRTLQCDVLSRGASQLIRRYGVAAQLVELEKLLLLVPDTPVLKRDFCFHRMSSSVTDFLTIKLYRITGNLSKCGINILFTVRVCCRFRPLFRLMNILIEISEKMCYNDKVTGCFDSIAMLMKTVFPFLGLLRKQGVYIV
ncbi:hypothetical protein [Lactonifactor sp. BIOML-A7]|uniref:hypothetical protein n=1 Tax=Lactonifactor sp. BIOML-A7 TaxID=2584660 RepID=UPI0015634939|nr:hypothetical protein [Lactonifactor sp. BIOML-A7]